MSYRKLHVKSKLNRIKPKKSIFKMLWFWIIISSLIIVGGVAYFAIFYSGFQLKNINISGNSKTKTEDLQNIISKHANTGLINFWNVKITSRSIFLINKDNINKDILKQFPEIDKITIKKNFPQDLAVEVAERKPIGIYCSFADNCFLIDQNGIIFEPTTINSSETTIVRQVSENSQIIIGEKVVAQNIINAIFDIQKSLKDNFKINLTQAMVTSPIRLDVTTSENWKAYFDLSGDSTIDSQLNKLNTLLNKGIPADKRQSLRYVDLRPKDRAIVCDNSTCGK